MNAWGIKICSIYVLIFLLFIILRALYRVMSGRDSMTDLATVVFSIPALIFLFDLMYWV